MSYKVTNHQVKSFQLTVQGQLEYLWREYFIISMLGANFIVDLLFIHVVIETAAVLSKEANMQDW